MMHAGGAAAIRGAPREEREACDQNCEFLHSSPFCLQRWPAKVAPQRYLKIPAARQFLRERLVRNESPHRPVHGEHRPFTSQDFPQPEPRSAFGVRRLGGALDERAPKPGHKYPVHPPHPEILSKFLSFFVPSWRCVRTCATCDSSRLRLIVRQPCCHERGTLEQRIAFVRAHRE
jgi:hypothetical protein